jgi:hypothetical protein
MNDQATEVAQEVPTQNEAVLGDNTVSTEVTEVKSGDAAIADTDVASNNIEFLETVGEDYRATVTNKGFNSTDDVIKAYNNLEGKLGKNFDELTNEELSEMYVKLGAPESPEGYEFEAIDLPEGQVDEVSDWFAGEAHKLGINKEAANALRASFLEKQKEGYEAQTIGAQVANTDNIAELKKEFGSAYDERLSLANAGLNEFGDDGLKELISQYGLTTNPAIVKAFAKIGALTAEGTMPAETQNTGQFGLTPAEAEAKIAEKMGDEAFYSRYSNPQDPLHAAAFKEIEDLYKKKNSI